MAVRPIDASRFGKILEQWRKDCLEDNDTQGADIIADAILELDDMPTLTPPNEWVSVEKALPPEHETVLCIVSGKPKSNITLEDAYQLGSWNKADGWIIDEWLDWEGANVTWWMKLPESPDRRLPKTKKDSDL